MAITFSVSTCSLPVANACCQVSGNDIIYYVTGQPIYESVTSNPYQTIAEANIVSVLSVRDPQEYTQPPVPFDLTEADQLIVNNVAYTNVPLPHIAMTQEQFNTQAYYVATVINFWAAPLLVHCSSGDRASAAFAVFMIQYCGTSPSEAASFAQTSLALKNEQFIDYVNNYPPPE